MKIIAIIIVALVATQGRRIKTDTVDAGDVYKTRIRITTIETAVQICEIRNGKYPDSLDQLTQPNGDRQPLLDKEILTDAFGNSFRYNKTGDIYEIRSAGADNVFDTDDDIINP